MHSGLTRCSFSFINKANRVVFDNNIYSYLQRLNVYVNGIGLIPAGRRKPGNGDDFHLGDSCPGKAEWNCWCDEKQDRGRETTERKRSRGSREGRQKETVHLCIFTMAITPKIPVVVQRTGDGSVVSAGGVPGHGGHHRKLPGMESSIWPGNEWTEEKEAEGGGAGQQGQADG